MASTFTPHLNLEIPARGDYSTTGWDTPMDANLNKIDTWSGGVKGTLQAPNVITLTALPSQGNAIQGETNGSLRWQLLLGEGAAETGSNAGSNFVIAAFSDTGAYLSEPLTITRASGVVNMSSLSTSNLAATNVTVSYETVYGTLVVGGATTLDSTLVVGSSAQVNNGLYVAGGTTTLAGALNLSGAATFYSTLNVSSNTYVGGTLQTGSGAYAADFFVNGTSTYLGNSILQFQSGYNLYCTGGSFFFNSPSHPQGNSVLELDGTGALGIAGQAYKPGGGDWVDSSDARIKTVERGYDLGLNEVLQLQPVVYRFTGNDAAPGKASRRLMDRSFVGLVAQEVESIMPGMVSKRKGYVDGEEVDDLRDLDTTELIFALVNAVKTLAAEVAELKAAR